MANFFHKFFKSLNNNSKFGHEKIRIIHKAFIEIHKISRYDSSNPTRNNKNDERKM